MGDENAEASIAETGPESTDLTPSEEPTATEQPKSEDAPSEKPSRESAGPETAKTTEASPQESAPDEHPQQDRTPEETSQLETTTEETVPPEPPSEEKEADEEPKPDAPKEEQKPEEPKEVTKKESRPAPEKKQAEESDAGQIASKKSDVISDRKSALSFRESKRSVTHKLSGYREGAVSSESFERKRASSTKDGRRMSRLGSKAQKILGSTIDIRRLSTFGDYYDRSKTARYMNTYKLDSDNPFNSEKVQKILEVVMLEALENLTYDLDKCPKQAKWASSAIRARVKELQFDRYKIVSVVSIGEKTSQDVLVTCRFLWDTERDRYAHYSIENTYVYGIAMCFGLYYE